MCGRIKVYEYESNSDDGYGEKFYLGVSTGKHIEALVGGMISSESTVSFATTSGRFDS